MNRRLLRSLTISGCLMLLSGQRVAACSSGSATITNLFSSSDTFQVAGLNSAGDLTGYFFGSQSPHAFLYHNGIVNDLGTLGGPVSEGFAINSSGNVVGVSYTSGFALNAFLYTGGGMVNLGALGGTYSSASLINDAGQVAGDVQLPNASDSTAFLYSNGSMISLGTLGGTYSSPFALNAVGQVTGESYTTNGDTHAFLGSSAGLQDLGTLGGTYSSGFDLDNSGNVVGESMATSGETHAFLFSGGSMTDLGTLGGTYSSALHINTNGQVIGIATTTADAETHAFIYSGGSMTDLGTLGGTSTVPYAINGAGQVVGTATISDGTSHAFIWQKGQLTDLNSLLPNNSGWQLTQAQFINDAGRIVGSGMLNGVSEWFILDLPNGNQPPVAVAGPDQTIDCQAQVTLDGSHSNDPDNDALTYEWSTAGNVLGTTATLTVSLPMGTNLVTLKVTDTCGASSETNLTVVVADTTPPTGTCPNNLTVSADANCQALVPDFTSQVAAHDNCTPTQSLVITQTPAAGSVVVPGQYPVTITVTDLSGNSATCSVLLTVVDTTPPTILSVPAPFTLAAGANCQATVPNVLPNVMASDACTPANLLTKSQVPAAGTLVGLGDQTIVVTVKDASGNSANANVSFKVADTTAPTILSGPSSVKLSADANCQGTVPNVLSGVLATDNCTPANQLVLTQSPTAGTVLPKGFYTITVTVADLAGNKSSLNVPLEIDDTTAPTILSGPSSVKISADANCQGTVPNILSGVLATDNCTPANQLVLTQSPTAGTVLPKGIYTITVTVADLAANKSNLNVPLEIDDTTAPAILSVPSAITLSSDAHCQAIVPDLTGSVLASDNCTPAAQLVYTQSPAPGTVLSDGSYTITITVTDAAGNHASATVPLSIVDTTAPVFQALSVSPAVLSPPNHQLVPVTVSASVTDNCDAAPLTKIVSITCNETTAPGDIQITGNLTATLAATKSSSGSTRIYTITVQSTDASGNSSNGSVTVSVPKSNGSSGSNGNKILTH